MPSIKKEDIEKALVFSRENGIFNKLNDIYKSLPSGQCSGCGNCCMESVGISLTEFLNIYDALLTNDKLRKTAIDRIFDYYFYEYTKKNSCPFKDDENKCMIYEVRPLNCRIYGHWSKEDYEKNYERIRLENEENEKALAENYNISIKKAIMGYKIQYCQAFKPEKKYMTKTERMDFYDAIVNLDSKILGSGSINLDYKDRGIVDYFIESKFYKNVAFNIKLKVNGDVNRYGFVVNRLKKLMI